MISTLLDTYHRAENRQLSSCGNPAITDTPIIQAAAKSHAKMNCRRLTSYKLPLLRMTLANEDINSKLAITLYKMCLLDIAKGRETRICRRENFGSTLVLFLCGGVGGLT